MKPILLVSGRPFSGKFFILVLLLFLSALLQSKAQCPPVIAAIPPSASVCVGDSIQLSCLPSTGTTWQWYNNGIPVPGATGSVYYAKLDGNYTVITGGCGIPSNSVNVVMMPLPFVSITINSNDTLCNGQQVNLSVTTGPNVQWVWLQPVGLLGQTTNPFTGTLTVTTTYQVVAVDQTTTCANTATITIPVVPQLMPGTINPNDTVCIGDTPGMINGTSASGGSGTYAYQWEMSTTSSIAGFSVIPGATGQSYQPGPCFTTTWFRRLVSSPPCPDMYSNTVMVLVIPTPVVTSPLTRSICSGNSVNYTPTSSVAGSTFTWTAVVTAGTVNGVVAGGSGPINTVLSVPAGSSIAGEVTYTITPTGPATSYCPGIPSNLVVTVNPTPVVTNAIMTEEICAGNVTTPVLWTSNVAGTTYTWSAMASPGLSGYQANGTGSLPPMQIFSTRMNDGTITYIVIPTGPAPNFCPGTPATYVITVHPSPTVINTPLSQSICSGDNTTLVTLASNVIGTTFTWTATAVPPGITGYQVSGTNTIPVQTIFNPTSTAGVVTYHILPSGNINGCAGVPSDYDIFVTPIPDVIATPGSLVICSGMTTGILLSSSVAGTTFSWTASAPSSILGFSNGSGNSIVQTLSNTSNANHDVTYVITPTANGCVGNSISVVVTVIPAPNLTVMPTTQFTCSGVPMTINLTASLPGTAFTWTASATGSVTGYSNGSGPTISQTLVNNDNVPRNVVYAIMMSLNGCVVGPENLTVTVYPTPLVTNSPLTATRCSGAAFMVSLTSNVAGTTYSYTANGTPGISGFSGGSGNTISQTLTNSGTSAGTVTYTITPTANGCAGPSSNYVVTVNPVPSVIPSLASQAICSGTSTSPVTLSSPVAGTTFTWTASPSSGGITGFTGSGSGNIPSQVISSTLTTQGTVTYTIIPTFSGCTGGSNTHIVTINPLPLVTNPVMNQAVCSGSPTTNVNLQSNVAGTTFTWIAVPSSASITGYQPSGTNTIPAQTITNSSTTAGTVTYIITPTSNFGPSCNGTSANYVTTVNPVPSITSSLSEAVCSGQPFNYTITGSLTGSTFLWSRAAVPGISNPSSSGSSATINETLFNSTNSDINVTYVLSPFGQAPMNCAGVAQNLIVRVRALPIVNAGPDLTIPHGTNTIINGSASGGSGTLNVSWTPLAYLASGASTLAPQTTNLYSDRTFTLSVTDGNGCNNTDPMTVFITGSALAAAPTALPATICLGNSSVLSANATGGSGTYTYYWSSSPAGFSSTLATVSVSPLVTTVYTVVVDDGFNQATSSVTVTVNPLPLQYSLTGGGEYCSGGPGVVVGLANSQSGVSYQLFNNGTPTGSPIIGTGGSISFGNQTLAGTYTVVATRVATGCTQDMGSSVSVSINPLPVANAGIDQTIPYGISTNLNGSVSGGNGPMSYSWIPLANIAVGSTTTTPLTTNLYSATTFTFRVTDAKGCIGTDQMTVFLNGSALAVVATATPDEICADTSQSQLNAVASGGSGSYTYSWSCVPSGSPAWSSALQSPVVSPDVTTTYTVTANDGYNTATASISIIVNPLPNIYSVTGGGSYCFAGAGVPVGLSGSEPGVNYQLFQGGIPDGPPVTGTGSPISFGDHTAGVTYTVIATNNITGCVNSMSGSTTINILPPPNTYLVTGGGSYPFGGIGVPVGLSFGESGVAYQLMLNSVPLGAAINGTDNPIDFGLQTQAGTYTVIATDLATGCTANMTGSAAIVILPLPNIYNVYGGGDLCQGDPGLFVSMTGSETGIHYQLLHNGFPYGSIVVGNGLLVNWGPFAFSGTFEVRATNPSNGGSRMMDGQAVIVVNPLPTLFTMNPTGSQCPGTIIRLNGSDANTMYYLQMNGFTVDSIAGTGLVGFLDYGPWYLPGHYTIIAVDTITGCHATMNGSIDMTVAPDIFNVIPAGILCPGQTIGLTGSETGVSYQLRWNGTFDLGAPVPGTGGPITVGVGGLPGVYSVIAIDDTTNCVSYMQDSATLYPDPVIYTIIPNGDACEGDEIWLNGSETGVDYVLLLDNAIHLDTIHGTGSSLNFGPQLTEGNYTIIAISQTSYCITAMNGTAVFHDSPVKYDLVPAGIICMGTNVGLTNSQSGVSYQLILNGTILVGSPVAGTGSSISFGVQNAPGTYTVRAINDTTLCNTLMNGTAVLDVLPTPYTITPTGNQCPGTVIGLNGSDLNYNYILIFNGVVHVDTISGNGGMISFGPQMMAGNYTVEAYSVISFCNTGMNGTTVIETGPVAFNVTPAGNGCIGDILGLDGSEVGVSYQLRINGTTNAGSPVAGTGAAISFGSQTFPGVYTVIATGTNGCTLSMNGSVTVNALPIQFTITPSGTNCSGTILGVNGSETGVNYVLILDGTLHLDTIAGTGGLISFGPQVTTGNYTVLGYSTITGCQSLMNGSTDLIPLPTAFAMTPAGLQCIGTNLGLINSEIGVSYQLVLNNLTNIGTPVAGTGTAISFGVQNLPGTYTVLASSVTGCSAYMSTSIIINPLPIVYSVIPAGANCVNSTIGLNGSDLNVNYILILNGATNIDTVSGTGTAISFGPQSLPGIYTVLAYNTLTSCQNMMSGSSVIKVSPLVYTMTPTGEICLGDSVGLTNSEVGVSYQLRLNGLINVGSPLAGTGLPLNFGIPTVPGIYSVMATSSNGCSAIMNDSVVINPLPVAYTITPAGAFCTGTSIGLNGSETGISYVLLLNGAIPVDTLPGTGGVISFGTQVTTGIYTVLAYNTTTLCSQTMIDSVILRDAPLAYPMTPAGIACVGTIVGLSNSEAGITYQLRRNGMFNVGAPVSGTGSALSFGIQNLPGLYTIEAYNGNGCTAVMADSLTLYPYPAPFTLVPSGNQCAGTLLSLNGSETGMNYILWRDGLFPMDTIPGTGSTVSFGAQFIAGTYTATAYSAAAGCQSNMNGSTTLLPAPIIYTMTPAGINCLGTVIGLNQSETGTTYQLRLNGVTNAGSPLAGTGSALNFGAPTVPGIYSIVATSSNGCTAIMNDSVILNPLPVAFTITPAGTYCTGTNIGLNGSETGTSYVLVLNGVLSIDTLAGTGSPISFGTQITTGIYTIEAFNNTTHCSNLMNDSVVLQDAPIAYNMTPAGIACVGSTVGLSNSETGITYQLRRNGMFNVGAPLTGTGSAISFGVQTLPGLYTIEAYNGNGCTTVMSDSLTLYPYPVPFTIGPSGNHCPGTVITLNGSETGMNYILWRDGLFATDTLAGNGTVVSFGPVYIPGTYTATAYSLVAGCQSNMLGSTVILPAPAAFNVTPAGISCTGSTLGLDDSETGVTYQLIRNGIVNIGAPVAGTGSAISFGVMNISGLYTVVATSTINGCATTMNGVADLRPSPLAFTIFPQGMQCAGTIITLNGSQIGTDYVLVRDGIFNVDTLAGTGAVLSFGPQFVNGNYTILAIGLSGSCQTTMIGSCDIMPLPVIFNITPVGQICASTVIGLDGSETGVNYILYKNGISTGITLAGTGSALSFGLQNAGNYTIMAINATSNCMVVMNGTATINNLPSVNAGPDQSVCSNIPVSLNATSGYTGTLNWVTLGDGTFNTVSILNPVYTLGTNDIINHSVTLILQATGIAGCISATTADTLVISITDAPVANAGPDVEVCLNPDFTLSGASASNYTSLLWTSSGTGNFVNAGTLTPTYVPSAADLAGGSVVLTLTVSGNSPCNSSQSDNLLMTFHPFVTVNAGADDSICSGNNFTVPGASAVNYSTLNWTTLGSGSFTGNNSLTPTYFPSALDLSSGSVQLVVTAFPVAPCTVPVRDTLVLHFIPAPTVYAGADASICEGTTVSLTDAAATNYSSLVWTTSGTGTFTNTAILHPVYTPSMADIIAGNVTLTLQVNGNSPCAPITDQKVILITRQATVNAGPDALICEGDTYTTSSATAGFYTSLSWTSTGTGTFANGNTLAATYTPSAADITAGTVTLTLTATSATPCSGTTTDSFILHINKAPSVNAGPDASICSNIPYSLTAASASNYASVQWTTSGTGSFTNSSIVNPVYNPSMADLLAGSVTLTLSVTALPGCTDITDSMVLILTQPATVNAGTDTRICNGTYTLAGTSAANVTSILWTVTTGTGLLVNANTLTPTYTPSAGDITNGFVILTLTGTPISPCSANDVDDITLMIDAVPVVDAGADENNCMGATIMITDATSQYQSSLLWTTTGTGTLLNPTTINPTYIPSSADLTAGSVTLTLTASNLGCGSVSDTKTITFIGLPVVNAGPDILICQNSNVIIGGASASDYSSISWSTSGTGTFANGNTVSPTYTPSAADISLGVVTLTLNAAAIAPCTGTLTDNMTVTISRLPVIHAGPDAFVCANTDFPISDATAVDADSLIWTTSGTGTFTQPTGLVTLYQPSAADLLTGSVTLTLTGYNNPCNNSSDSRILTFVPVPVVDAGINATICNTCVYAISGATATNTSSVTWTSTGSGTFSNPHSVSTVYQPSAFDYSVGHVILELMGIGITPCAAVSDTMTLYFSATPGVDFTWGSSCEEQPVSFQVDATATNIGAIVSWHWDFGDGSQSALMNPSHVYSSIGTYTVALTVVDTSGYTHTNVHPVYVSELPVAYFAYQSPNCSNQSVHFTDLSHTLYGNISQWVWMYGDGSSNDTIVFPDDPNTNHLFTAQGSFTVTLLVTNSFGCVSSTSRLVDVIPAPVANFIYTTTCQDLSTQFEDASAANGPGNIVQWWWDFGDPVTGVDNFSNLEDPIHNFSGPGTYTVTHVARNFNNCNDTIVKQVVINPAMAVDFTYHHTCVNDLTYFEPDPVVVNISNVISWTWDFGDGGYSYQQSPAHNFTLPGSYEVTLTISDINGCTSSKKRTVLVHPAPVVQFNLSQQNCKGQTSHFDDVSTTYTGYIISWTWDFGDGNQAVIHFPLNPDVDHAYTTAGTYAVTLTVLTNDSCTASQTQYISVEDAPTANFESDNDCFGGLTQFNDLSQTGGTGTISGWEWNFGDPVTGWSNLSTAQNPTHAFSAPGTYQVSLTVHTANGCTGTIVHSVTIHPAPAVDFYTDAHCANSPVNFHPASVVNIANVASWLWNFGDGLTGNQSNPVHTYAAPGNYNVTLTITDVNGCQNSVTHLLQVYPLPSVVFGYTQPACSQSQVQFTSNASAPIGHIVTWVWNFGDGNTQTIQFPANPNPTHQYSNYGIFNVTLTVTTNDSCTNSLTQPVNILQSPVANFSTASNCASQAVQFQDLSQGNPVSWNWNFGDPISGGSNVSTFQNPTHTYYQAGNYQVTLQVLSANGCTHTLVKTVTITAAPNVDFTYNNGCASDTVQFSSAPFVIPGNTASWLWNFGDNSTATTANPGHIYQNPGTYPVTLTVTSTSGCTNSKTHQVVVSPAPIAQFNVVTPACSGSDVHFDDISFSGSGSITSWHWDFGDGGQATVNAPANPDIDHIYPVGGIFTVTLTIHTSNGCENTFTSNVSINNSPLAAFSVAGTCTGAVTSFSDLSQPIGNSPIGSWSWNFGDPASGMNNTSNVPSPYHIYDLPGTYVASLAVVNTIGCSDTLTQVITIAPPQAADFFYSQPACDGSAVTFNADPSVVIPATISSYDWDFGDGSVHSTSASPGHVYPAAGTYSVTLTVVNNGGCEGSATHQVTIHTLPVAQFTQNVTCTNNQTSFTDMSFNPDGSDIVQWHWDFGVGTSSADTSALQHPTYSYASTGVYNVSLTVTTASGCTGTTVLPVTIIPAPTADYIFTAEPCHNGAVLFQDQSNSQQSLVNSWYWEFQPGSYSTLKDPVYVYGFTDTTFQVTLVAGDAMGCTDTVTKQVYIPKGLEVSLVNTPTCFGETTYFNPQVVSPVGDSLLFFDWNFGEPESGFNNTSYVRNPSHTYANPGPYVVSLVATDINNCTSTSYLHVYIAPIPKPEFATTGGDCDSLISFTDKTSGADIATWIWNFGDGSGDTIQAPVSPDLIHAYAYAGVYDVTLTTTSVQGCTSSVTQTVRRTPCIVSVFDMVDTLVCQKKSMHFVDHSVCQAPIASWTWDFGDNTVDTYTNLPAVVTHTYSEPGVYEVVLTVATQMVGGAVTASSSMPVSVNPAPKSNFTWDDVCIGNITPFKNASQGNGTEIRDYSWKFGDPNQPSASSADKDTEYQYGLAGKYNVKLISSNTIGCYDTIVKAVKIFAPPQADFEWKNSCQDKPVYFADATDTASADIETWNWYFSDETSIIGASTEKNPSYSFNHAGLFNTKMIVVDKHGCSDTIARQVAINSSPVAAFSFTENYENVQGQLRMNNGTMNGSGYLWDFGNGETSYGDEPVVTYDRDGKYTIKLVAWNGQDCGDTITMDYSFVFKGLYIPNAFAPEDTHNGVTEFKPSGMNLKKYQLEVYDRWGNFLWSSDKLDAKGSPTESWDGTLNNILLPAGVYLWRAKAIFRDGTYWDGSNVGNMDNMPQTFTGTVTLIR